MIRAADLSNAATWAHPTHVAPRSVVRDESNWLAGGVISDAHISADPNPAARGLTVEQHTHLILALLCDR